MINSAYTPDIYTGNGVTTTFPYGNKITHKNQLRVTLHEIATGDEEVLVVDTDYDVSGVGEDAGGNVTYSVSNPMASTHKLIIERKTPILQETDFEEQGGFHAATHEDAVDKLTAIAQEKEESDSRAPKFSVASGLSDVVLPTPESGKYLRGNATNDGYENAEPPVSVGEASPSSSEPTALTASASGAAGSSGDFSRADHRHGLPLDGALNWTGVHTHTKIQKWAKGADIAPSGNVLTPGNDGNYFDVTGTAGFTSIAAKGVGTVIKLHFDAALTITHHATDLILPGGANITTAAGDEAELVEYASGDWRCTSYTKASGQAVVVPATVTPVFENRLLHVRDEKAANTEGGTFTGGLVFRTRTLNTVKTNEISGASLSSNQITLPAGTYYIEASAPHVNVNQNRLRLRNVTDSTNAVFGPIDYSATGGGMARLEGRFTIAAEKVFELQHTGNNTQSGNGFGIAANSDSMLEVFAEVRIWKVA